MLDEPSPEIRLPAESVELDGALEVERLGGVKVEIVVTMVVCTVLPSGETNSVVIVVGATDGRCVDERAVVVDVVGTSSSVVVVVVGDGGGVVVGSLEGGDDVVVVVEDSSVVGGGSVVDVVSSDVEVSDVVGGGGGGVGVETEVGSVTDSIVEALSEGSVGCSVGVVDSVGVVGSVGVSLGDVTLVLSIGVSAGLVGVVLAEVVVFDADIIKGFRGWNDPGNRGAQDEN